MRGAQPGQAVGAAVKELMVAELALWLGAVLLLTLIAVWVDRGRWRG